ncbi:MAG: hypothetical protein M1825_001880 [Sarcosagium campestre]|nr:MAG: hypothetical protein M1825_001880 [Sarcosagium campestre]
MSQHAGELSVLLINDTYGELSSRIFSVLLRFGRLTLPTLAQYAKLPVGQLKHGLAVLIQQHLVLHFTSPDDDLTYYEAHWQSAYELVRSGKLVDLVDSRFDEAAGQLVLNLLLQGHAKIGELREAYESAINTRELASVANGNVAGVGTNGIHAENGISIPPPTETIDAQSTKSGVLQRSLRQLLAADFVGEVTKYQFRPFADTFNEAIREAKRSGLPTGAKGTKADTVLQSNARDRVKRARDGDDESGPQRGAKRLKRIHSPSQNASYSRQDRFLQDAGLETNLPWIDDDYVVGVNHEKCCVAFRNQQLVELAKRKIGPTTARVYAELLQQLEAKIPRCHDPLEDENEESALNDVPTVTTRDLYTLLGPDTVLDNSVGKVPHAQIDLRVLRRQSARKRRRLKHDEATAVGEASADESESSQSPDRNILEVELEDEVDADAAYEVSAGSLGVNRKRRVDEIDVANPQGQDVRVKRLKAIRTHLELLEETPHGFVELVGERGLGEWTVDFNTIIKRLRQETIEDMISARFGPLALRLTRILADKGKVEEKQLGNMALTKQKEVRVALSAMHAAGFLALQEVPRDASRAVSRTIYLWYFDVDRCATLALEETYKAMARLLQRASSERALIRGLLTKAERTDVVGKEELYLSSAERRALKEWKEKEERLLAQVGRLDTLVAVLRDF